MRKLLVCVVVLVSLSACVAPPNPADYAGNPEGLAAAQRQYEYELLWGPKSSPGNSAALLQFGGQMLGQAFAEPMYPQQRLQTTCVQQGIYFNCF